VQTSITIRKFSKYKHLQIEELPIEAATKKTTISGTTTKEAILQALLTELKSKHTPTVERILPANSSRSSVWWNV